MQAGTLFLFLVLGPGSRCGRAAAPKSFFKAAAVVGQKRQTTEKMNRKLGNMP